MRVDISLGVPGRPDDGEDPIDGIIAGSTMGAMLARMAFDYPDQMLARIKTDHGDGTYTCDRPGTNILMKMVPSNSPELAEQLAVGMTVVIKFYNRDRRKPFIWRIAGGLKQSATIAALTNWWQPEGNHHLQFTNADCYAPEALTMTASSGGLDQFVGSGSNAPIVLCADDWQWHCSPYFKATAEVRARRTDPNLAEQTHYVSIESGMGIPGLGYHRSHWAALIPELELEATDVSTDDPGAVLQVFYQTMTATIYPASRMFRMSDLVPIGENAVQYTAEWWPAATQLQPKECNTFIPGEGGNIVEIDGAYFWAPHSQIHCIQNYYSLTADDGMQYEGAFDLGSYAGWPRTPSGMATHAGRKKLPWDPESGILYRTAAVYDDNPLDHPSNIPRLVGVRNWEVQWTMEFDRINAGRMSVGHNCCDSNGNLFLDIIEDSYVKLITVSPAGARIGEFNLWPVTMPVTLSEKIAAAQQYQYTILQMLYFPELEVIALLYRFFTPTNPLAPHGAGTFAYYIDFWTPDGDLINYLDLGLSTSSVSNLPWKLVGGRDWFYCKNPNDANWVAIMTVPTVADPDIIIQCEGVAAGLPWSAAHTGVKLGDSGTSPAVANHRIYGEELANGSGLTIHNGLGVILATNAGEAPE